MVSKIKPQFNFSIVEFCQNLQYLPIEEQKFWEKKTYFQILDIKRKEWEQSQPPKKQIRKPNDPPRPLYKNLSKEEKQKRKNEAHKKCWEKMRKERPEAYQRHLDDQKRRRDKKKLKKINV